MKQEKENKKRVNLTLNLDYPEDKEVYAILSKKKNMNYYIRKAVLYFNKGARLDEQTAEDIRTVVRETIQEVFDGYAPGRKPGEIDLPDKSEEEPLEEKEPDATEESDEDELDLSGFEDFF